MTPPLASLTAAAVDALEAVPRTVAALSALDDASLMQQVAVAARLQKLAATHAALLAGEVDRRSTRSLGHSGLAQRAGYRTPQELLRAATGSTRAEASHAVRVGAIAHDAAAAVPQQPWLRPVSSALVEGTLSPAAADAIRAGLGSPSSSVSALALADAATRLSGLEVDAEQLYRRAREERDAIDEAGIAEREAAMRDQRSFRLTKLADGMTRGIWLLDPESAATLADVVDRATSPRRGGPRFVNPDDATLSDSLLSDTRSTEQLASDMLLELVRHGTAHDSSRLLSTGAPVVRVLVTESAVAARRGHGFIEGQHPPVSIETVERLSCGGAEQHITVDAAGQPLELGREQRLFSRHQRTALAIRDGGCRWPGCDRPPSWAEAHHTRHWARDRGGTDVANGILLCRHHHLLLHNNGWEIQQSGAEFWLVPPLDVDPAQRPRPMPSKSPLAREAERARQAERARETERAREAQRAREAERASGTERARDVGPELTAQSAREVVGAG